MSSDRTVQPGKIHENNNSKPSQKGSMQDNLPQLDTTEEKLIGEVRGIYAGLVMVEKKCIEIDKQQSESPNKLSDNKWQALISLHRTLLHEHHDFFLA